MWTSKKIIFELEKSGFEAGEVGGCVRDELMGINSVDDDIATNASPDEIINIFKNKASVDLVGKNFGVIIVDGFEIATYRSEEYDYDIPGKPKVARVKSFYEDSNRRDFTINALMKKSNGEIIDYHNGIQDINNKVIRAVGNPIERFLEDGSRILRAIYFYARYGGSKNGWSIEDNTFKAIISHGHLLQKVPQELIGKIIQKVMNKNALHIFMEMLEKGNILQYVLPELTHTVNLPQNPKYHNSTVYKHIVRVVEASEIRFPYNSILQLTSLSHDSEKGKEGIRGVNAEDQPNDIGHEEASAKVAKEILSRLQFSKEIVHLVSFIVHFHGMRLPSNPKRASVVRQIKKMVPFFKDKGELKKAINLLFDFMYCDADGFSPSFGEEIIKLIPNLRFHFEEALEDVIFYRNELPINGNDLISLGFKGKEIGEVLDALINLNLKSKEDVVKHLIRKYELTSI